MKTATDDRTNNHTTARRYRAIRCLATAWLLIIVECSHAASPEQWDDRFGVPNLNSPPVTIDRSSSGKVAIGGNFSGNSFETGGYLNANKVAIWDGRKWSRTGTGANHGPGGVVRAVKWIGNDLYVGGDFFAVSGTPMMRIARWDGSSWHMLLDGLSEGVNGEVYSLAANDSQLYVGGAFTSAAGKAANHIARWDGSSWSQLGPGVYGGSNPFVWAIAAAPDGSIYAGGRFTTAGYNPAQSIARWANGTWYPIGSSIGGPDPIVYAIAIAPNGDVVVGGSFTTAGGSPASNLAIWNGSSWAELGNGVTGGEVHALAFEGNKLWVGGTFDTVDGGQPIHGLATLENGAWSLPGGDALINGAGPGEVNSIRSTPDGIYLAGTFSAAGDKTGLLGMAFWDGTTFHALHNGFFPGSTPAHEISAAGDQVMLGGDFSTIGGHNTGRIARWDGDNWQVYGTPSSNGVVGTIGVAVDTVATAQDGSSYVGGAFMTVAGIAAQNIAHWNGTAWEPLGTGLTGGNNPTVRTLALTEEGVLYAAGNFTTAGGEPVNHIAKWDGNHWSPLGDGLTYSADPTRTHVYSLAWAGDRLYAGGGFDKSGALDVNGIAWWDGYAWHALDGGMAFSGSLATVESLAVSGFDVFAGGDFDHAGTTTAADIAQWNGTDGWRNLSDGFNSSVSSILIHGQRLFAAGNFTQSGMTPLPGFAEWDGNAWQIAGGGLVGDNAYAIALAASQTNLYVSGNFESAGSEVSSRFGILHLSNSPPAIAWVSPAAGDYIANGANVPLEANASDSDGNVVGVDFYVEGQTAPLASLTAPPWTYSWPAVASGVYRVAARVTDDSGASTWSLIRRFTVLPPGGSIPPSVTMTAPTNGASFKITSNHLLSADAWDPDGTVVQVSFHTATDLLGTVDSAPWEMYWPNIQPGTFQLRAVALDDTGMSSTSAVVNVTVLPPNQIPYVQIRYPRDTDVYEEPGPVLLGADCADYDGQLVSVKFLVDDQTMEEFTSDMLRYTFYYTWENVPPGDHTFRAVAEDDDGATNEASIVFNVAPFNQPPTITWIGPADGSTFPVPNSIPLTVDPEDSDGTIAKVEWLRGDKVIGTKTNAPWVFSLRNITQNTYPMSARATDNLGKSAVTPVVSLIMTNDPAQVPSYRLVDLNPPGGNGGQAYGINDNGDVVLSVYSGDGYMHSYRYTQGEFFDIGTNATPVIDLPIYATGINDTGEISGYVQNTISIDESYEWTSGNLNRLGFLGDPQQYRIYSRARAINNQGWVVGLSVNSNNVDHAFLWKDGVMKDLGSSTYTNGEALAVNDNGQIVGWLYNIAQAEAFLYDDENGMQPLGFFGGLASRATDINNRGQIVGSMYPGGDYQYGFLRSGGQVIQLGLLDGNYTRPNSINDQGQIVGSAEDINSREHAFLWQDCAMIDLNQTITNSDWELRVANAINNHGWIVGFGLLNRGPERPFLLIPEDESQQLTVGSPIRFENGRFQLCVPAAPNTTYRLDASTDFKSWTSISTNYVPEGVLDFRDPNADAYPNRFYRAVLLP